MPNLVPELLVSFVHLDPKARFGEPRCDFASVACLMFRNRRDDRLDRCQPSRERAAVMFDQNTKETFQRARKCAMDHDWVMILTVGRSVLQSKASRQHKIHLYRAKLPRASNRIPHVNVQLRSIKGPAAVIDFVLQLTVF